MMKPFLIATVLFLSSFNCLIAQGETEGDLNRVQMVTSLIK